MFICMPFFHAMGLKIQFISCLINGTAAHIVRRFSATTWLDDIRACKATVTYGLGVIPEFIYRQPPTPRCQRSASAIIRPSVVMPAKGRPAPYRSLKNGGVSAPGSVRRRCHR